MKVKALLELEAKNNLWSHAYLFVGQNKSAIDSLLKYIIEERGILTRDVEILESAQVEGKAGEIKAEAIRELIHRINLSSSKGRLAVIYGAEKLNQSSGNLLLKTLEEPPPNSVIILVSSNLAVLPTLKSRCRLIRVGGEEMVRPDQNSNLMTVLAKDFAGFSAEADKIAKEDRALGFLEDLEQYLRQKLIREQHKRSIETIKAIEKTKKAIKSNANTRLLLENLYIQLKNDKKKDEEYSGKVIQPN